jgi:hypothetical protein
MDSQSSVCIAIPFTIFGRNINVTHVIRIITFHSAIEQNSSVSEFKEEKVFAKLALWALTGEYCRS